MAGKYISTESMNQNIKKMEYAVRGPLVIRAVELEKELQKGIEKPFTEVIKANIGDCQAMGQKPLTFIRQVVALCSYPELLKDNKFPEDVKSRAKLLLQACSGGSIGSYTHSSGIELIRKHIVEYIEQRDGFPSDESDIIISSGASEAVKSVLSLINNHSTKRTGVMIPIPQYPLYSATICEYGMHQIGYYLDEGNNWALSIDELNRALKEAKQYCDPKALVVINPGNPTGSVLTEENIKQIIRFAYSENLVLMADEVYQDNVYAEGMKFYSFKKIMKKMGPPYDTMELASFMSASKGYMGECGMRGGYCELLNFDPDVKVLFMKAISARLCSNVVGQIVLDCIVKPPQKGEPSYECFVQEKNAVLSSLKQRAIMVADTFNSITGIQCNKVAGAMYAFPRLTLPLKAIKKAESLGQEPDFFYAMELLETTGICVVPGSGFGQIPGTYHFRTTILPQPEKLKTMLERFKEFHENFLKEYA